MKAQSVNKSLQSTTPLGSAIRPLLPPPPPPLAPLSPLISLSSPLFSPSFNRRWILEARSQGRFEAGTKCHACGANYAHPLLTPLLSAAARARADHVAPEDPRIPLAVIGGTGYVGRCLALHLVDHPTFRLGAIVGSSATAGRPYSAVFEKKEESLLEHYGSDLWTALEFPAELSSVKVESVEDVIAAGTCRMALSFIAPEHGEIEDRLAVGTRRYCPPRHRHAF